MTAGHWVKLGGTTWNARDESQDEDTAWHLLGVTAFGHSTGHDSGIVSISTFGGWNSPAPKSFVIVKDSSTVPDDIIFTNYNPSYKITATSIHRAFGIHSGHNDCYEIYQGVRQAEADWNVKVVLEH